MLLIERLEPRLMFDCSCDINMDGQVTTNDALQVINALNNQVQDIKYDANNDGHVSPIDILNIINYIIANPPYIPPAPSTIFTVTITDSDTVGFTDQQVIDAIHAAFAEYADIADVGFRFVPSGGQISITTYEIYVGNGVHGRGIYLGNGVIGLHNGIIAPYHHSGRNGPRDQWLYYQVYGSQAAIQQVVGHEFGHYLGLGHSSNTSCRMHSDSPPGFCQAEVSYLISRFGPAK